MSREKKKLKIDRFNIIFVGWVEKERLREVIDVALYLKERKINFRLKIVGEGSFLSE